MATSSSTTYPLSDTAVRTTLASGITSTDTSFDVGEVTNAPTTPFLIAVWVNQSPLREDDMELMEVTGISGTTLTVNRGQKGTTAQSFSSGDKVFMGVASADVFDEVSGASETLKNTVESNTQTSLENLLRSKSNEVEHNNTQLGADDALWDVFADKSLIFSTTDVAVTDIANDGDPDGFVVMSRPGGWDVDTAELLAGIYDLDSDDTYPKSGRLSQDGSKMYMAGNSADDIYQYDLSVTDDVSSASLSKQANVGNQTTRPEGHAHSEDGSLIYVLGRPEQKVFEYSLSTAWDIGTMSYTNNALDLSGQSGTHTGIDLAKNQEKIYTVAYYAEYLHEYTMSTAGDLSTATHTNSVDLSNFNIDDVSGVFVGDSGNFIYLTDPTSREIVRLAFGTKFDTTTLTRKDALSNDQTYDVFFRDDGKRMYLTENDIEQYKVSGDSYANSGTLTAEAKNLYDTAGFVYVPDEAYATIDADIPADEDVTIDLLDGYGNSVDLPIGDFTDVSALNSSIVRAKPKLTSSDGNDTPTLRGYSIHIREGTGDWDNVLTDYFPDESKITSKTDVVVTTEGSGTNGKAELLKPGPATIDDFEDNNLTGWTEATGDLSVESSTVLNGDYSGDMTTANAVNWVTSPAAGSIAKDVWWKVRIDTDTGNSGDGFLLQPQNSQGTKIIAIQFQDGTNDLRYHNGSWNTAASNFWSPDTTYQVELRMDYTNETLDIYVDGTAVDTGVAFTNSVSSTDEIRIRHTTQNSGDTRTVWFDDLHVGSDGTQNFSFNFQTLGSFDAPQQSLGYTPSAVRVEAVRTVPTDESIELDLTDENNNTDTITTFGSKVNLSTITGTKITPTLRLKSSDGNDTPTLNEYEIRFYK